ncbi:MAG: hypothetical protein RI909_1367 [Bacteroidota bacterium]|jgi:hypothetical protein
MVCVLTDHNNIEVIILKCFSVCEDAGRGKEKTHEEPSKKIHLTSVKTQCPRWLKIFTTKSTEKAQR